MPAFKIAPHNDILQSARVRIFWKDMGVLRFSVASGSHLQPSRQRLSCRSPCRRSGTLSTARRTSGFICLKRSTTLPAPKSGEQLDQTVHGSAEASRAITASGIFGRCCRRPVAPPDAHLPQAGGERGRLPAARPSSPRPGASPLTGAESRLSGWYSAPQDVLGVVQLGTWNHSAPGIARSPSTLS